jgi:hypothetical protein
MIQSKENSQDKINNKIDKNWKKYKKEIPLIQRNFNDLTTLKEQFEWIKLKKKEKMAKSFL